MEPATSAMRFSALASAARAATTAGLLKTSGTS